MFDNQINGCPKVGLKLSLLETIKIPPCSAQSTTDEDVFLAMTRMHRQEGRLQQQAYPLTSDMIDKLFGVTDNSIKGYRDRALLKPAYDSMRQRSELCSFQRQDLEVFKDGAGILLLRFSKPDQEGIGKRIPLTNETVCALLEWKNQAGLKTGKYYEALGITIK